MAYIDLNPILAKTSPNVDESEYRSIFESIYNKSHHTENSHKPESKALVKFIGAEHQQQPQGIHFTLIDYLELVDWTGRVIREGKRGTISSQAPALLAALGLDNEIWLNLANDFGKEYH